MSERKGLGGSTHRLNLTISQLDYDRSERLVGELAAYGVTFNLSEAAREGISRRLDQMERMLEVLRREESRDNKEAIDDAEG